MPRSSLEGRVVAITGGARGIGLATARALLDAGARVAIGDVDKAALVDAGDRLGEGVLTSRLDVRHASSLALFLELAERELGALDVLVNNAGIMPIGRFEDEDHDQAQRAIAINVLGPLHGTKLALRHMLPRQRGHIVNVASVAGRSPVPGGITYAASKAAIVSMTESMRVEFAGSGIKFTCVMPSFTATELIAGTKGTRFVATVPPDAVANAIVKAIARPRHDVFVPRSVGAMLRLQPLLSRRLRDAMNHAIGADTTFLDVDHTARAAYQQRISADTALIETVEPDDAAPHG